MITQLYNSDNSITSPDRICLSGSDNNSDNTTYDTRIGQADSVGMGAAALPASHSRIVVLDSLVILE